MVVQLTAGSCQRLHDATPDDEALFNTPHTLQFLSIKKVNAINASSTNTIDRYRIIMSDGINFIQAMLATQLNHLVSDNTIGKHTVAVVTKLTCNYVQDKRLIIILELRALQGTNEKIGEPKAIVDTGDSGQLSKPSAPAQADSNASSSTKSVPQQNISRTKPAKNERANIYPIEGLSPYQNNWTIKARVTQKSEVKKWSNDRGEGKLFNVTFMDESGEIRGTGFNLAVDELYHKLEEGKVYYVSRARVNLAKKKFSNLTNDYELSFERNTEIEECLDTNDLPTIKYNFVPLSGLESVPAESTVDVIGVIKEVGPLGSITSKATSREVHKRELTLVDTSGYSVRLTLWGKQAEEFSATDSPVIAFRGVKVGDFGGRSLSMFSSSTMQINPDLEECFALRGWYDSSGAQQSFQAHSNPGTTGSFGGGFNRAEMRTLFDVKQQSVSDDKGLFFSTRATIMHIKADNLSYPACPSKDCNKKVVEENGGYRCEKCDKSYPAPEHRYIMSMAVADSSGQAWLQGFNDVGLAVFGMSANDLYATKERDELAYNAIVAKANFNTFNFACRAKKDSYNGNDRVRYGISSIQPLDYKVEALALRDLLHSDWAR